MVARQVTRSSQKEETRLHGAPAVLDGSPAVQVRKRTTHSSSLYTPKRLTFLNQTEASAIARLAEQIAQNELGAINPHELAVWVLLPGSAITLAMCAAAERRSTGVP